MLYITVLIKIKNHSKIQEFETQTVRIMQKHGGIMLTAYETNSSTSSIECYDEVHHLQFPDTTSFDSYRNDPELDSLSDLRYEAISKIEVFVSKKIKNYNDELKKN